MHTPDTITVMIDCFERSASISHQEDFYYLQRKNNLKKSNFRRQKRALISDGPFRVVIVKEQAVVFHEIKESTK